MAEVAVPRALFAGIQSPIAWIPAAPESHQEAEAGFTGHAGQVRPEGE